MTMPLAGMEPRRKAEPFDREEAEERAFRMLSEGECVSGIFPKTGELELSV